MTQLATSLPDEEALVPTDVFTLPEAASWLRVDEQQVIQLVTQQGLPGRQIGEEWRFHKDALSDWLSRPRPVADMLRHAGVAKDDPYMDELLEQIYRDRGRPMTEDEA